MQKKILAGIASGLILPCVSTAVGGLENTANQSIIKISEQPISVMGERNPTTSYINLGLYVLLTVAVIAYADQTFEDSINRHQLQSYEQKKH